MIAFLGFFKSKNQYCAVVSPISTYNNPADYKPNQPSQKSYILDYLTPFHVTVVKRSGLTESLAVKERILLQIKINFC